jgi:hypothetical protein
MPVPAHLRCLRMRYTVSSARSRLSLAGLQLSPLIFTHQDETTNVFLSRVTSALEPVYTETVHTHLLARQGVSYGDTFVDDVSLWRGRHIWGGIRLDQLDDGPGCWLASPTTERTVVTGSLENLHSFVHSSLDVACTADQAGKGFDLLVGRTDRRQESYVDALKFSELRCTRTNFPLLEPMRRLVSLIASLSASGLGCVKAVSIPRAPADATAAARGGVPTHCMPTCQSKHLR